MSPRPGVWTQVFVLALLFLGGGVGGLGIARSVAPGSFAAEFFGMFAFPLSFGIGMQVWLGMALVTEAWRTIRRGFRPAAKQGEVRIPPGSFAFVPTSVLLVGSAGLPIALFGSSLGALATIALYLTLGLFYGTACWLYARNGYLPFPQE
ncbi:MAG TPA: hypothetical protein VFD69_21150 [Vicinamibacterales bacterium]|nr:hypothetical protein [Vicinamibacterales bacterium]